MAKKAVKKAAKKAVKKKVLTKKVMKKTKGSSGLCDSWFEVKSGPKIGNVSSLRTKTS